MASSTKFLCLFFLLSTLLCSPQIHARDSHFFSKVTRERDDTTNPSNNFYNNNENEAETFSKEQKQQVEPVFAGRTTEDGYGLYGHETGLDAPSLYNMDDNKFEYDTKYYDNNNNNKDEFAQTKYFDNNNNDDEFAQTKYFNNNNEKPNSFNSRNEQYDQNKYFNNNEYDQNNYFNEQYDQNKYLNNNNEKQNTFTNNREQNYAPELKGLSEFSYTSKVGPSKYVSNNNGGVERQGMSDTRYLENGKYYYDINSDKKFDNLNNNYMSYNNNNNNNKYNNVGQYYGNKESNNHGEYYKNNYYNANGMQQEFHNQFPEEGEFDFDDQP